MTADVFRLGLIGAGRMGRTHLRALADSRSVTVTAVAEPAGAAQAALSGLSLRIYGSVEALLGAGGLDGVLIAAPSDRHAQIVEAVAAAGLPILCEKPCGTRVDDVRRAAAAARHHGVPLQVAYWRRFVPELMALRDQLQSGEMGDVHLVCCFQWDGAPPSAAFRAQSGGIFIDMGVHEFDQLRWLTGQRIESVMAMASPLVADIDVTSDVDSGLALVGLSGGATGLVSLGRWFPAGDMARVEVFATRDAQRLEFLDPSAGEVAQLDALRRQAAAFAAFARGGPQAGASADDAQAALEAAARASAAVPALRTLVEGRAAMTIRS